MKYTRTVKETIRHMAQYSTELQIANWFYKQNFEQYANKKDTIICPRTNKNLMNRNQYLLQPQIPNGRTNTNLKLGLGTMAYDINGIAFPAYLFPTGSLRFNVRKWRIIHPFDTTAIIYINNNPYILNSKLETDNTTGLAYKKAQPVVLWSNGLRTENKNKIAICAQNGTPITVLNDLTAIRTYAEAALMNKNTTR